MTKPIIDPEFHALIPPLSDDERIQLEANIKAEGCRDALVVWDGILLDGHNRMSICERLGIKYQTRTIELPDKLDAKLWIRKNQSGRRNLTDDQRAMNAVGIIELESEKAKKERAKAGRAAGGDATPEQKKERLEAPVAPERKPKERTRKAEAKKSGVSEKKIRKAQKLKKKNPKLAAKVASGELSLNKAVKEQAAKERKEEVARQVNVSPSGPPIVEKADAIEWLKRQPMADMILTDPPYMTDVDDIQSFAALWLPVALSKMKPTGRAYICIGAYPQELSAYLGVAMPTQILVWTYRNTIGPSPKENYKLNWQAILYFKGSEAPPLDCPLMTEQFSVQDISAPDGRQGDRFHSWQKPMELGERFIRHATNTGDLVLDPFCCTGSFLLAAEKLGRIARGCDINPEFLKIAIERGCSYAK